MTDIDAGCECRASGRHDSASHFLSSRPVDIRDDNGSALPGQFLAKRSANPRRTPRDDRNQILKWHETKRPARSIKQRLETGAGIPTTRPTTADGSSFG